MNREPPGKRKSSTAAALSLFTGGISEPQRTEDEKPMLDLVNNPSPTPEQLQAELDALTAATIRPADDPIPPPDGATPEQVYFDVPEPLPETITPEELVRESKAAAAVISAKPIPFDDAPAESKAKIIHDYAQEQVQKLIEMGGADALVEQFDRIIKSAEELQEKLLRDMAQVTAETIAQVEELAEQLKARQKYLNQLEPFLRKELKRMHQEHPETEGVTLNTMLYSVGNETIDEQELADLAAEFADETDPGLKYIRFIVDAIRRAQAALDAKRKEKEPRKRKQVHIDSLPGQLIYPLDAVNHYAAHGSFQAGEFESVEMFPKQYRLPNGKYTKGKPVEVFAMLEYEGTDISQRLDLIDSAILRAIYSLLDAGETRFSVSHIWELIAGEGQKTNRSRIESLVLRIRRMIGTTAKISFQQFAEAKGLEYTDDLTAQILPGVALRERRNARGELVGADLKCTQPLESFPLYQFAEITGQIDRAPIEAVTVRGSTQDAKPQLLTDNRLTVREMIYQRIFRRHRNKSDQVILFATLYEKVGATTTQQQIRVRDAAESFLIEWAELGTIYNYSFRKKGKNIDAIVIANTPEEMQNHPGVTWLAR
jgi:hypothetical protein